MSVHTWITADPIDAGSVLPHVGASGDGAIALFLGVVREHNDGRAVSGMRYEAYPAMAARVLADIAQEAGAQWSTDRIAVVHRTGELAIGEASIAIAVSTPHRAEAFEACRFIIEAVKERLPVWKHEHYTDGEAAWLANAATEDGAP